jgi:putative peptidoglycan lipid II flippase
MTENVSNSSSARNTYIVSACIFLSRIFGLLREVLLAFFLGTSIYSDAFKAALKIPNILQNLFGEGVLSASFIPEYVRLIKNEKKNEAILLAKQSGLLLLITAFILAGIGMYFNSEIVNLFAPGFSDETKALTKNLLLILFPATAILMLSAWCLGILNSHRHFLLSYSAPLFWNISIISGLLLLFTPYFKTYSMSELIIHISLFVLIGSILQLAVQLKKTFSLIKIGLRVILIKSPQKRGLKKSISA